jgi:predicted nucleotidyltransferase
VKLEATLRALYDEAVEFVIIGGVAMQLQGSARLTEDLDICYSRSPKNIEQLARALKPHKPVLRDAPEGLPFSFDADTIQLGLNFSLVTDLGALDCLGEVSGLGNYDKVKAAAEKLYLFGMDLQILALEGLIRAKRAAGRSKDLTDIKELEGLSDLKRRTGL